MTKYNEEKQQYTFGCSESIKQLLQNRSIKTHGQFMLPYLTKGLTMLDCGCGPGTMTVDFARYLNPGKIYGIDINEHLLETARENAIARKINNIEFKHASIFELPFADDTFDIVFTQALLTHLKEPMRALKEMKRVVKKGGLIAAKEPICSGVQIYPNNKVLQASWELRMKPFQDNGANIDIGLELGKLFVDANLTDIEHNIWCRNYKAQEIGDYYVQEFGDYPHNKKLLKKNEITSDVIHQYQQAWSDFAETPGACFSFLWGECVGYK